MERFVLELASIHLGNFNCLLLMNIHHELDMSVIKYVSQLLRNGPNMCPTIR